MGTILMVKLTAATVKSRHDPGMYADDACRGLYLCVGTGGAKSWILRTTVYGKRREIGLGSVRDVSLAEARDEAQRLRKIARAGGDPATKRSRETITFAQATQRVHAAHVDTWKNRKHTETWLSTIENHVYPSLGTRPIETIGTADILAALQPIWTAKHETAKRLKQRLAVIFDWAKTAGHYHNENPVNGITRALPIVKATDNHMDAMAWADLPAFMADLRKREGVSARCLEFIILTASRSGEARGARWEEFDLKEKVWTVPGSFPECHGGKP